jgi:flagellar hook assembly protein FlgD
MLQISLPEQLSRVTVRIYDLKGRVRRKIVNQQVLSAETELLWDGKDDAGKRLTCGVYVMHLDAVALDDEKVYSRTETVVIGK